MRPAGLRVAVAAAANALTRPPCLRRAERSLSYAKIMQARGKQADLLFPERSLSYAKIMQARGKQADLLFPERSLSYAKIMQARGKQADLLFPERSLSYAKIQHFIASTKCLAIFRSGNTKKLVHDAEANANTWHGGKAESTYPHTGSRSRNRLGTTANRQTRQATIGLATAHRCKILLPPWPVSATNWPSTDCKTTENRLQNGPCGHAERQVLAGEKGRLAMQNGIDTNNTDPL